ncbi:uncharacterized protein LOC141859715 [Acropora palmata]|uniref:uncharacterized protein LOC141859715 n=1 Tax=Acropora palmata TaxID=6131 RepID=UPI003DA11D38
MAFFISKQETFSTAFFLLLCLFSMYEQTGGMPTTSPAKEAQSSGTDQSDSAHDSVENASGHISSLEKRMASLRNPCVAGPKYKLIDGETVIKTVTCKDGCKEIKRLFYFPDRELPLVFVVDCESAR